MYKIDGFTSLNAYLQYCTVLYVEITRYCTVLDTGYRIKSSVSTIQFLPNAALPSYGRFSPFLPSIQYGVRKELNSHLGATQFIQVPSSLLVRRHKFHSATRDLQSFASKTPEGCPSPNGCLHANGRFQCSCLSSMLLLSSFRIVDCQRTKY